MEKLSLDEELICAVCRDIFSEPVTLPCGHNYCEECVNKLKRASLELEESNGDTHGRRVSCYTCPLCLAPCDTGVELRKNTVLHNIVEKYRRGGREIGVGCSACKGERKMAAEKSCVTCEESYCTLHLMPHLENVALRHHVLVEPVMRAGRLCKEHGKELELFCRTEQTALCVYCLLPSSENTHLHGHDVVKLADAQSELKKNGQAKLDNLKDRLAEIKNEMSKLEEASSSTQEHLESQQRAGSTLLNRIKLFLEMEDKAWQKRFSVDMVQEKQATKLRTERLDRLRSRLVRAHEALLQALSITEPLILLQTIQNADWEDLFDPKLCKNQILEALDWKSPKPIAAARTNPLLQAVCQTFAGDEIVLNAASAHPRLRLNANRSAVWVAADTVSVDPGKSGSLYCILAETPFTNGVHHWEATVDSVPYWAVGISYGANTCLAAACSRLGEDNLSWALSYSKSQGQFCAQHDWLRFCFSVSATDPPRTIGVFLDIESGILSFYDALEMGHLYTFYCDIEAPVYPAFCLGTDSEGGASHQIRVLNPISQCHIK